MHIKGQHKTLATVSFVEFADFINQGDEFREAAFSLSGYKTLDLRPKCPQNDGRWGQTREVMGVPEKQRTERMVPCLHSPRGLGDTLTSGTAAWAASRLRTVPQPLESACAVLTVHFLFEKEPVHPHVEAP